MSTAYPTVTTGQLSTVLEYLRSANVSLPGFLQSLVACDPAALLSDADRQDLDTFGASLLTTLDSWAASGTDAGGKAVNSVFAHVEATYAHEIQTLTEPSAGFHFNASNATEEDLKKVRVKKLAYAMRTQAPRVWSLLDQLMSADKSVVQERAKKRRRRAQGGTTQKKRAVERRGVDVEGEDIGQEDGDDEWEDMEDSGEQAEPEQVEDRRRRIIEMRKITCISIAMQSTNILCNAFQSSIGFFLRTANAADIIIECFSRLGVCVSSTTIQNGVTSFSSKRDRVVKRIGRKAMALYSFDNLDIDFKHPQPTATTDSDTLAHLTTATIFPLHPHIQPEDLNCADDVWKHSQYYKEALHGDPTQMAFVELEARQPAISTTVATNPVTAPGDTSNAAAIPDAVPVSASPPHGDISATTASTTAKKITLLDLLTIHQEVGTPSDGLLRRDRWNAWKFLDDLVDHGPEYFRRFRKELNEMKPEVVDAIPLTKSNQVPLHAMDINPNTPATNGEALDNMFAQAGLEPDSRELLNKVILVSGDLLTGERIRSLMASRSEESTDWRRLHRIVFVMGLFHFKMACADALWRIFIRSKAAKEDPNSLIEHVGQIRPKETGKIQSKAEFRRMHEVVQHVGICSRLECWLAKSKSAAHDLKTTAPASLEDWAESSQPTFNDLVKLSRELARDFVSDPSELSRLRLSVEEADRDLHYENMLLQQQLFLLYEETTYAMNNGDIGRVETCFLPWAFVFQGCGKHKYASELYRYLKNVWFIYPPGLRRAVRYSILVNPTGKPGRWRGIDWVIEHNNLYIKRIYGGRFSNRKKKRILIEAALIEVYKTIRIDFEDMYCLNQRSLRHSPPDMTASFRKLRQYMQTNRCHTFIRGRKVPYHVPDMGSKGMAIAMSKKSDVIFSDVVDTVDPDSEWAGLPDEMEIGEDGADLSFA